MKQLADFGELRQKIDDLIIKIKEKIKEKSLYESSKFLEEAHTLLNMLSDTAKNDIEENDIGKIRDRHLFI